MSFTHGDRVKRWIVRAAATGIALCLASLVSIYPWRSASQGEVESARRQAMHLDPFTAKLVNAALDRTQICLRYDSTYLPIPYPGGDVPASIGVCTDEVIRSYRHLGIDLQRLVHEDMMTNFAAYPTLWGLQQPDSNIDHRRVPNLQTYFTRQGASMPVSSNPADYLPGDLVTYLFEGNRPHIAIVVPSPHPGDRPWIMHNRGFGPKMEDQLFKWTQTGHYRWRPAKISSSSR